MTFFDRSRRVYLALVLVPAVLCLVLTDDRGREQQAQPGCARMG